MADQSFHVQFDSSVTVPQSSVHFYRTSVVSYGSGLKSNLGDVVRATIFLKLFPEAFLLTDNTGYQLLRCVYPLEKRILCRTSTHQSVSQIVTFNDCIYDETYSIDMAHMIKVLTVPDPYTPSSAGGSSWQEHVTSSLNRDVPKHAYLEPTIPNRKPIVDVLLLHQVHHSWQSKSLTYSEAINVSKTLRKAGYTVCVQPPHQLNFSELVRLIQSAKVVVSPESLSLHLSLALKKRTILLEGPIKTLEGSSPLLTVLSADINYSCSPCYSGICLYPKEHCIPVIAASELITTIGLVLAS